MTRRLGLIVNPVAGLGGRVGLKGSDGPEVQKRALELGAVPQALERATRAVERLRSVPNLEIVTYPHEMGADAVWQSGLEPVVIGAIVPGHTTAEDTRRAAQEMQHHGVELLLFAGGDGTARDIYEAIGPALPVLGIPAGVKIHSAVFATNPRNAGDLAALYLQGQVEGLREAEVMDIDEEAVRQGIVSARLAGYLRIPYRSNWVQSAKVAQSSEEASLASLAYDVVERMKEGWFYILGPGTTVRAIANELGISKTLIGVDVIRIVDDPEAANEEGRRAELVIADASEAQLLALLRQVGAEQVQIVVTLIGGQGCLFGRGNQPISPRVLEQVGKENIVVVSTPEKLYSLGNQPLWVDTGDPTMDQMLCGYIQVVTGYHERAVRKVVC